MKTSLLMFPWLAETLRSIEEISSETVQASEPDAEVGDDEQEVGIVAPELRKLHAYRRKLVRQFKGKVAKHAEEHTNPNHKWEDCEAFHVTVQSFIEAIKLTRLLFLHELRTALKAPKHEIDIRKGWKVVQVPEGRDSYGAGDVRDVFGSMIERAFMDLLGVPSGDGEETEA